MVPKGFFLLILRVFPAISSISRTDNELMTRPVRNSLRVPAEFIGTLELMPSGDAGPAYGIHVTDVSSAGVGITLKGEVPVGTSVRLIFDTGTLEGTIIHCRAENGHYAAGIRIDRNAVALSRIRWAASLRLHQPAAKPAQKTRLTA